MKPYIILIIAAIAIIALIILKKKKPKEESETEANQINTTDKTDSQISVIGAYQKKWMFTYHEKDAYKKLKPIAEDLGYTVFAKVRLLDLLEPIKGHPKYKTLFYKIQAKHVDFVLCDQKLVARCIIELDDSSHNEKSRQERDKFVDEILKDVGYQIIHTREITDNIRTQISKAPEPQTKT